MATMRLPKMSTVKPPDKQPAKNNTAEFHNRLRQKFSQKSPNLVWVSDLTYIRVAGRWHYLCVIIDLFSRKVVAWEVSEMANSKLVENTFIKAYKARGEPEGLMFHSDRGCQYTSESFRRLLDKLNVVQSFSKKGYPFDNAVAESFFKYLKQEETNRRKYRTITELRISLFE